MPYSATGTSTSLSDHRSLSSPKGVSKRHFTRGPGAARWRGGGLWVAEGIFVRQSLYISAGLTNRKNRDSARGAGEGICSGIDDSRTLKGAVVVFRAAAGSPFFITKCHFGNGR